VCQKDWFSSVTRSRFLKYPIIKEKLRFRNWLVGEYTSGCCWNASDVVAVIALLGLSVHGPSLRFQIEIVE